MGIAGLLEVHFLHHLADVSLVLDLDDMSTVDFSRRRRIRQISPSQHPGKCITVHDTTIKVPSLKSSPTKSK